MIVPSPLFLKLALVATPVALGAVFWPSLPVMIFALPWIVLLAVFVVDVFLSVFSPKPFASGVIDPEIFVGETSDLEIRLSRTSNPSSVQETPWHPPSRLGFGQGQISPPRIKFVVPAGFRSSGSVEAQNGLAIAPLQAVKRGTWKIDRIWVNWTSRLGLIDLSVRRPLDLETSVVPNIRTIQSGEVTLKVRDALFGSKNLATRGGGSEFHQLSEFSYGMDARAIDWKQSAKHRSLYVKEKQAETNHQIIIALDHGHLSREELQGVARLDHGIHAGLALAWAALMAEDQVGLFLFGPRPTLFLPPKSGRPTFARSRSHLADLEVEPEQTNHALCLSTLQARLARRSLVVILSDFSDPLSAEILIDYLAGLQRRHLVVFVSLLPVDLHDQAHGRAFSMDGLAQAVSAEHLLRERRDVLARMRGLGIDVLECAPGDALAKTVNAYLEIKQRARL
ncbi:MAG: DUF58 domain-containing protein [Pseudomonadota bacterium]